MTINYKPTKTFLNSFNCLDSQSKEIVRLIITLLDKKPYDDSQIHVQRVSGTDFVCIAHTYSNVIVSFELESNEKTIILRMCGKV